MKGSPKKMGKPWSDLIKDLIATRIQTFIFQTLNNFLTYENKKLSPYCITFYFN